MVGLVGSGWYSLWSIWLQIALYIYNAWSTSKPDAKLSSVIKGEEWDWLPATSENLVNSKQLVNHDKEGGIEILRQELQELKRQNLQDDKLYLLLLM